jgi:hypothetical protein
VLCESIVKNSQVGIFLEISPYSRKFRHMRDVTTPSKLLINVPLIPQSRQPRTQDLSLGKTLAAAGHVPHQKSIARGGVGKVLNYINMLPVGYSLKT